MSDQDPTKAPVEVVLEFMAAVGDGRIDDVLALTHPDIMWSPITRPGRSVYTGHAGTVRLVADVATAYGQFRLQIHEIAAEAEPPPYPGTRVTVRSSLVRRSDEDGVAEPETTVIYTVRAGLVVSVESTYS